MNLFKKLFKPKGSNPQYDMDSLDGINKIPIPKYEQLQGMGDPSDNIEYILQKKATEHKRNGRMDLAIACLRKSNEIFPHEYFIISTQYDELKRIPDSKKEWRDSLLSIIDILKIYTVYTTPAIYGKVKYGLAKYGGDTDAFNKIIKKTRSNINDALIASSAIFHEYILVTDDDELYRKMKNNQYEVITYFELLEDIKKHY